MQFIADLHIHSHFSIATSASLNPRMLDLWARRKGITVVGTGDAVHGGWIDELKKTLAVAENGLLQIKPGHRIADAAPFDSPVYFVLTAEISCIYKWDNRVRKVHNVIVAPDFSTVRKIRTKLDKIGNIDYDGRPIVGIDSRDLLELVLEAGNGAFLFPAHIWTPWFSVLGSNSGFNSIEECFRDLSDQVFALETGLSSDPAMNWKCSFLDRYALISNSDAHSPENLGREANIFDTEISFAGIAGALSKKGSKKFMGTIEYFPEEGKYHLDGHRRCGICWEPSETKKHRGICPVCGKEVTIGVLYRVEELADRRKALPPVNRTVFSVSPLKHLLGLMLHAGERTKKVDKLYMSLLHRFGPEFSILLETPIEALAAADARLARGIARMRQGHVTLEGGYDGVFGRVNVF